MATARLAKSVDEPQHGPEQAQQRRQLRDGGQHIELFFKPWHLGQTRRFERLPNPVPALVAVENGRLDQPRYRPGSRIAN